ncbi:hypothetical protein SeLEV6574_g00374 [Synchytrium endobioticum]|uniref:JmjC domain-containing protein n=1 Tax=Synchytrium endobioticum TaxID=286115 RepID=A0A507DI75_9FUNG|nr:hypothetical protein SeLEV6574_g00374 [Synchytrium endobioticum]
MLVEEAVAILKQTVKDATASHALYDQSSDASIDAFVYLVDQYLSSASADASTSKLPTILLDHAKERLAESSYSDVSAATRCLHQVASMCIALDVLALHAQSDGEQQTRLREAIRVLDTSILVSGAPYRGDALRQLVDRLQRHLIDDRTTRHAVAIQKPAPSPLPHLYPRITTIPRIPAPSIAAFLQIMHGQQPVVLTDCISHWPALSTRPWLDLQYLAATMGPDRMVPVEIGASYADDAWTQRLVTVAEFFDRLTGPAEAEPWYLAQHSLFTQFPALAGDIVVPDYCHACPSEHDAAVRMNAWFGPKDTYSPLHTDPFENLLAQVVGYKRAVLVAPCDSAGVYPYDGDTMLHNTAQLDVENPDLDRFPLARTVTCYEAMLEPGDVLYIPVGWWHALRSLSTSFSVSFWFS